MSLKDNPKKYRDTNDNLIIPEELAHLYNLRSDDVIMDLYEEIKKLKQRLRRLEWFDKDLEEENK